jgi:hypothetical protein
MMLHEKCPLKTYNPKDLAFGPQLTTLFAGQCDKLLDKNNFKIYHYKTSSLRKNVY